MSLCLALMSLMLFAFIIGCAPQQPPERLIVRAGRLIDGRGSTVQLGQRIIIERGTIVAVRSDESTDSDEALDTAQQHSAESGVRIIDARGYTVMPGLIDSHTHLFGSGACTPGVGVGLGQILRNLHGLLRAGITTVADLAAPTFAAVALRNHVGTAQHRGPRLLVAGSLITRKGGYLSQFPQMRESGSILPIDSVPEARAAVQQLKTADVDLIKLAIQENNFNLSPLPYLEPELACAAVEEAHRQEMRVLAHATTKEAYRIALDCGIDGLVHGSLDPLDPALLQQLQEANIPIAPTAFVFEAPLWGPKNLAWLETPGAKRVLSQETRQDLLAFAAADAQGGAELPDFMFEGINRKSATEAADTLRRNVALLAQAKVPLSLGSDSGACFVYSGGAAHRELELLGAAGLPLLEVIRVGTQGAARMLNLHDALGTIAPGYRADLIVVEGNPDEDLSALQEIRQVIIDGIPQEIQEPSAWNYLELGLAFLWAWIGV